MKLIALFSAVALAAGTLVTAAPAEAQRYGYDRGYDRGFDGRGFDRRGDRRWQQRGFRGRGFDRARGYRDGRGYGRGFGQGRGYGRSRVVCRIERGYYGPVRNCFRVFR